MYNLFVSENPDAWDGDPWTIELGRCVREYTDKSLTERFGELDAVAISELVKLPSIFAYEFGNRLNPRFGLVRDITRRQDRVRVEYELQAVDPFLQHSDFDRLSFELDVAKWEMNRTHWGVKDVALEKELNSQGIRLPAWVQGARRAVDISRHAFKVSLSFPGEARDLVEEVTQYLEAQIGPDSYFYDNNYVAQLARPSLDVLLQDLYRNRSDLIVVFLSTDYQSKRWCGIEFRAIRDIIAERDHPRVMFIRMDDGAVEGVFANDGYIDARRHTPLDLARFIQERAALIEG